MSVPVEKMLEKFLTKEQRTPDVKARAQTALDLFRKELQLGTSKDAGVMSEVQFAKFVNKLKADPRFADNMVKLEPEVIFAMMDLDQNGTISEQEYVQFVIMKQLMGNLIPKFQEMDRDGDGTLTVEELRDFLQNKNFDSNRIASAIKCVDKKNVGRIDYMELSKVLTKLK